jgi:hypothetical protein
MRLFLACVVWWSAVAAASIARGDAFERLQPQRLKAVHEAIDAQRARRRTVALDQPWQDVRALLHVHSAFSHDSRGTIDEIVAGAREAGAQAIMFNEHPANHYDYYVDGHRGMKDGVLLVPGAETEGFLAFPRRSIQGRKTESPQAFSDLVRSTGGLVFVSHLEERMDWEVAGVTGVEIYNTHADVKDEARLLNLLRSPTGLLTLASAVKEYPQEVFGALLDYPADYLQRYDVLCQRARHTGVAANDAHHNQAFHATVVEGGKVLLEDALGEKIALVDPQSFPPIALLTAGKAPGTRIFELDLDPYARSFRHVSTHLLLSQLSEQQLWQALNAGRAYVAFDWLADPTGFVYCAQRGSEIWPMGSETPADAELRLRAEAPLPGRFKLVRSGVPVLDREGVEIDFPVAEPGVYRLEVWLNIAGEDRPWILTNPIYVR